MFGSEPALHNSCLHDPGRSIFDRNRFPYSRDYALESLTIACARTTCAANHGKQCVMPSLISITAKGVCKGFKKRRKKNGTA